MSPSPLQFQNLINAGGGYYRKYGIFIKKVIKVKQRETKYPFVDKVLNYQLTKHIKDWSSIAAV